MESIRPVRNSGIHSKDIIIYDEEESAVHIFSQHTDHQNRLEHYRRPGAKVKRAMFSLLVDHLIAPPFHCHMEIVFLRGGYLLRCLKPPALPSGTRHTISVSCADVDMLTDGLKGEALSYTDMRTLFDRAERDILPNGVRILNWILENILGVTVAAELSKDAISWSFLVP